MASKKNLHAQEPTAAKRALPAFLSKPLYYAAGFAACFILFLFTGSSIFGLFALAIIVGYLNFDLYPHAWQETSWMPTVKEASLALLTAYAIWIGLQLILASGTPIDVVTSCSMVPDLQRGDLILVSGTTPQAPVYHFTGTLNSMFNSLSWQRDPCLITYSSGVQIQSSCTTAIYFEGQRIPAVTNNDVIVYDSQLSGVGLIVHRAVAVFTNGTNSYYFTKGDNNGILDQESIVGPVDSRQVLGHVVARVPYVGFLKLFMYLQFTPPQGCDSTVAPG